MPVGNEKHIDDIGRKDESGNLAGAAPSILPVVSGKAVVKGELDNADKRDGDG